MFVLDWLIDNAYLLLFAFISLPIVWAIREYWIRLNTRANRDGEYQRISEKNGFEFLGNAKGFGDLIQNHLSNSVLVNLSESKSGVDNVFDRLDELLLGELISTKLYLNCQNVAHQKLNNGDCFLFDFSKTTMRGRRKNRTGSLINMAEETTGLGVETERKTVIFGHFEDANFPAAIIRPKSFKQKLLKLLQKDTIKLTNDAQHLHDKYYLMGRDLPRISDVLGHRLADVITAKANYEIEFWGNVFLVTLDNETGGSFRINEDLKDQRIGISRLSDLEEFTEGSIEMMRIVDELIPI